MSKPNKPCPFTKTSDGWVRTEMNLQNARNRSAKEWFTVSKLRVCLRSFFPLKLYTDKYHIHIACMEKDKEKLHDLLHNFEIQAPQPARISGMVLMWACKAQFYTINQMLTILTQHATVLEKRGTFDESTRNGRCEKNLCDDLVGAIKPCLLHLHPELDGATEPEWNKAINDTIRPIVYAHNHGKDQFFERGLQDMKKEDEKKAFFNDVNRLIDEIIDFIKNFDIDDIPSDMEIDDM